MGKNDFVIHLSNSNNLKMRMIFSNIMHLNYDLIQKNSKLINNVLNIKPVRIKKNY